MTFLWLKWTHILSATLLFGTGIGTAFYKYWADRQRDLTAQLVVMRGVVLADWWVTTPAIVVQLVTGVWMAVLAGYPLQQGWVFWAIVLYLFAGACWLPVVWLQIQMRQQAERALKDGTALPERYHAYKRIWLALGVPAFTALVVVFYLMVFKPALP
jgi:uncharacterized membrane protein